MRFPPNQTIVTFPRKIPVMPSEWTLIANPAAGGGRSRPCAERAAAALARAGIPVDLRFTHRPGHATELAYQTVAREAERLVLCGGDGSVREVLPALAGSSTALGLLPSGTANDFARSLGVPRRLDRALRLLLSGRTRAIDLGQVNGHPFATVASCGFDADANRAVSARQVPFPGTVGYLIAALGLIRTYSAPNVRLRGEFGECAGQMLLVASANTASYGGGMKIAPQADPQDGRLDVCIVDRLPPATVLHLLPRVFWGGHLKHPAVRVERTRWLRIETEPPQVIYADGDYLGETPANLQALPGALQMVLPPL